MKRHRGVIGVPDAKDKIRYTACRYEVEQSSRKCPKTGLNGGKITKLTIRVKGTVTAEYDRGWIKEPEDEPSQLALCILLYDCN